jgi:hypothetical protein
LHRGKMLPSGCFKAISPGTLLGHISLFFFLVLNIFRPFERFENQLILLKLQLIV